MSLDLILNQVSAHETLEWTLSAELVAQGYGVTPSVIRSHKSNHKSELVEGKHFVFCVQHMDAGQPPIKSTIWTKRGVVRLGFFIKSKEAAQFRDRAEDWIADLVAVQTEDLPMGEAARLLKIPRADGRGILGRSLFVKLLKADGYIISKGAMVNSAYQKYSKLFTHRMHKFTNSKGEECVSYTAFLTAPGLLYFSKKYQEPLR